MNAIKEKKGSVGNGILLWMLGVPLPVILLISMMRSC